MNVVFVAPNLHDNLQVQLVWEIVESAHSPNRIGKNTIWLLGMDNPNNVDETSLIKDTFTGLALTFDGDVFIYIADGDVSSMYEVYKISDDDEGMIVLPLGHWSDTARKLVMSEVNKHERRRDLKASTSTVWDGKLGKRLCNYFSESLSSTCLAIGIGQLLQLPCFPSRARETLRKMFATLYPTCRPTLYLKCAHNIS